MRRAPAPPSHRSRCNRLPPTDVTRSFEPPRSAVGATQRTTAPGRGRAALGSDWHTCSTVEPGKQTTKTLGPKSQISRRQTEMMREELVRPLNQSPFGAWGRTRSGISWKTCFCRLL
jgi:hypothetical protein